MSDKCMLESMDQNAELVEQTEKYAVNHKILYDVECQSEITEGTSEHIKTEFTQARVPQLLGHIFDQLDPSIDRPSQQLRRLAAGRGSKRCTTCSNNRRRSMQSSLTW